MRNYGLNKLIIGIKLKWGNITALPQKSTTEISFSV